MDAAFEAYLAAKAKMYERVPEFRIERAGPLWCFRNHPRWPERDAYYGLQIGPDEAVEAVVRDGAPPGHRITLLQTPGRLEPTELPGYRREEHPQPFLSHLLDGEPYDGPRAQPVMDEAKMGFLNVLDGHIEPEEFKGGVYRYYYLAADGVAVCCGRCVDVEGAIYVTGLDTLPAYRRRGLGHALMRTMESDAVDRSATLSVLLEQFDGAEPLPKPGLRGTAFDQCVRRHRLSPSAYASAPLPHPDSA